MMEKNKPEIIKAWCWYDWANSVYSLTITTAIFPVYFSESTKSIFNGEIVPFFGKMVNSSVLYSMSLSFSFLVIMFLSPFLSGIADYSSSKKSFMRFFAWLGAVSCALLYFFTGNNIEYAIIFSVLASIGFAGSLVFYNSYLPDIATPDKFDSVSARGFALGYAGSVILLILNIVSIFYYYRFGFADKTIATRFSFLTVGLWWFGFSLYTFKYLPNNIYHEKPKEGKPIIKGFLELKKVWIQLKALPQARIFLIAFFFYIMGVITVIYLSSLFASVELKLPSVNLIAVILVLQLVAIVGAQSFAKISAKIGNKYSLMIMVIVWTIVCFSAYKVQTPVQFYILAIVVGAVMGGIQSLSRSTYSKLIPESTTDTASFFSFYDVTEKLATVLGTFSFGLINQITHSMRISALTLGIYFIFGFIALIFLKNIKSS